MISTVTVAREMPSGNICFGFYLVDSACLGLKNTVYFFNKTKEEFHEFVENISSNEGREFVPISLEDAHNFIFGAIDYAAEYGFKPQKDWDFAQYVLDENLITDGIDDMHFGGKDGNPMYYSGPFDNAHAIIAQLRRTAGEDNFNYVIQMGNGLDEDDYFDKYDVDDDEDDDESEDEDFDDYELIK